MKRSGPLSRGKALVGDPAMDLAWRRRSQQAAINRDRRDRTGRHAGPGESRGRRIVRDRSGGWCEIHVDTHCGLRATEWSHRRKRSQGGTWAPSNGMDACHSCHSAITDTRGQRREFEFKGWIIRSRCEPSTVRVLMAVVDHARVDPSVWRLLTDDGLSLLTEGS